MNNERQRNLHALFGLHIAAGKAWRVKCYDRNTIIQWALDYAKCYHVTRQEIERVLSAKVCCILPRKGEWDELHTNPKPEGDPK